MTKTLLRVTVTIAVLALGGVERLAFAQVRWSGGAQPQRPSAPPGGRGGPPRPSPPPPSTSQPPIVPPFRSTLTFRPAPQGGDHRAFPVRLPWFGLVAFDPSWWEADDVGDVGGTLPPPVPLGPDDSRPAGGLQLDVEPRRALVYVDGWYVGIVDTFSGYFHHLDLPAGPHVIEFLASDYDPLSVEVVVTPGKTTTYRGALNRR